MQRKKLSITKLRSGPYSWKKRLEYKTQMRFIRQINLVLVLTIFHNKGAKTEVKK